MEKRLCEIYNIMDEIYGKTRKVEVTRIETPEELERIPRGAVLEFQNGIRPIAEVIINNKLVINHQDYVNYEGIWISKIPISEIEILTTLNNWLYVNPKINIEKTYLTSKDGEEYFNRRKIIEKSNLWFERNILSAIFKLGTQITQ